MIKKKMWDLGKFREDAMEMKRKQEKANRAEKKKPLERAFISENDRNASWITIN